MDLGAEPPPAVEVSGHPELLGGTDGAVDRDPRHDLRMDEMATIASNLPDAFIRALPGLLDEAQQRALQPPGMLVGLEPGFASLQERIHQLPVDVELELLRRRVADPHRGAAFVSRQPIELELREPPLA